MREGEAREIDHILHISVCHARDHVACSHRFLYFRTEDKFRLIFIIVSNFISAHNFKSMYYSDLVK